MALDWRVHEQMLALLWTFVLLVQPASAQPIKQLQCKNAIDLKNRDVVTHSLKKDTLHIFVSHRRGIGGANLKRGAKPWPKKIIVEFKNFHNLESFGMSSGKVHRFNTNLKAAPMIWVRDSANERDESAAEGHELKAKVEVVQKGDNIVATVPKEAYDWNVDELQIGWIDAYRR